MANLEMLALDTVTPQIRAPATGSTYLAPRTINITPETGTAHINLNGTTSGAISLKAQAAAGTYTLTFANALPGSTGFFKTDTSGNISFDTTVMLLPGLPGSTAFIKSSTSGTLSFDTATYLTGNQTITLSGDISGSGTTAITTALAATTVTAGAYQLSNTTFGADGRATASSSGVGLAIALASHNFTV
jgi:hypothetical protein